MAPATKKISAASGVIRTVGTKTCNWNSVPGQGPAVLTFGLLTAFCALEKWTAAVKGEVFDLVHPQPLAQVFWLKFSVQVTSSRAHLLQRRVPVTACGEDVKTKPW